MTTELHVVEVASGRLSPCVVTARESPEPCEVTVSLGETDVVRGRGYDVEEALQVLRLELEARGLHLLCNRYRRDAFVSSMMRQMTDGFGCYLVRPRRPVDPAKTVGCFEPADPSDVVSAAEAAAFIARWRARPPSIPVILFRKLRFWWEDQRDQ